jgi:RNA polymerase sigma-70 factor (ECF subfamily)
MAQPNRMLRVVPAPPRRSQTTAFQRESKWTRLALEGDRTATLHLLRHVGPTVDRTVAGILGPGDPELEDLTQEALVAFVRALPAFRSQGAIRSFAAGIAARLTLTHLRRRARRKPPVEFVDHPADDSLSAAVARRGLLELLREALLQLSLEQAETVHLRWVLGHDLAEVAEMTGVGVQTVRSRLRLARRHLERRLHRDPRWAELLQLAREDP